jgi:ubiquinone biosynthesis protein
MIRWVNVIIVSIKYGLDEYLASHEKARFLNLAGIFVRRLFQVQPLGPIGQRLRLALQELGPVFIKFGQIASTRRDLLPEEVADELAKLKDSVDPISALTIISTIESELGKSINELFAEFSLEPLASASVAQVHAARLHTGEDVVVKVLRPNIQTVIEADLQMFKEVVTSLQFFKSNLRMLNVMGMIEELEISILQELDLFLEATNADRFRENLKEFTWVKIPQMYKQYSTAKVLVMERMYGTPIDNVTELSSKGVDLKTTARRGLELLIVQIFRDRFFHADQHSGNVWITDTGDCIFLDFGIMGTLSKEDRDTAAGLMRALFTKNYEEFVEVQIRAGWVPDSADKDAIRKSFKNISGLLIKGSLATAFRRLLSLGEKHGIKVPIQFTLLVKTLIAVEGVAKTVDPDIDIGKDAAPIIIKHFSKWLKNK